jgi:hypothetical protein
MAKYYELNGLLAGMIITMTKDGQLKLRRKSGADRKKVKTAPAFKKTREIAKEFGVAGKLVKLLRRSFMSWIPKIDDPKLTGRMIKAVLPAIRADTTSKKGERNLLQGYPEMLEGFQFNPKTGVKPLEAVIVTANKDNNTATVTVAPFYADFAFDFLFTPKSLHCRIISICGMIDMDSLHVETDMQISELIRVTYRRTHGTTMTNKIKTGKTYLNFLAVGVEYCYVTNGEESAAANGSNDPLTIVKVIRGD